MYLEIRKGEHIGGIKEYVSVDQRTNVTHNYESDQSGKKLIKFLLVSYMQLKLLEFPCYAPFAVKRNTFLTLN